MSKELTRIAIETSFIKLLNEKPLDKITIKDIVLDCGVNRNTFYYHYADVYALFEDLIERETKKVIESYCPKSELWEEQFIASLSFAFQNKRAIYHIYNSANRAQLESYLNRISHRVMTEFVKKQAEGLEVSEEDIYYITLFYKHAIVGVIFEWIERGMQDDPEVGIKKLGTLLNGNIRSNLERAAKNKKLI